MGRPGLSFMYFANVDPETGKLISLEMVPMQIKNFRLNSASSADALWLRDTMNAICGDFGVRVELGDGNALLLEWD